MRRWRRSIWVSVNWTAEYCISMSIVGKEAGQRMIGNELKGEESDKELLLETFTHIRRSSHPKSLTHLLDKAQTQT